LLRPCDAARGAEGCADGVRELDLERDGDFVWIFEDVDRVSLLVVEEAIMVCVAGEDPLAEGWTRKGQDRDGWFKPRWDICPRT